jgi:CheY-like chemotaxis protein
MPMSKILLLVEDDPLMSRMYQKLFTFEGFQVETANDGAEGLNKAKSFKPDLIMMDIMMPNMNGMDALSKMKGDGDTQHIPVIMLTNLAGQQDREEALSKGATKYIVKSEYDPKQVLDIVKGVLTDKAAPTPQ